MLVLSVHGYGATRTILGHYAPNKCIRSLRVTAPVQNQVYFQLGAVLRQCDVKCIFNLVGLLSYTIITL